MSSYQEKITRHTKRPKIQFKEIEQASQPDIAWMLELSDWQFKTMVNEVQTVTYKISYKNILYNTGNIDNIL